MDAVALLRLLASPPSRHPTRHRISCHAPLHSTTTQHSSSMPPPSPPPPSACLLLLLSLLLPLLASGATPAAAAEPATGWSFFTIGDWVRAPLPPSLPTFRRIAQQLRSWVAASSLFFVPSLLPPPGPFCSSSPLSVSHPCHLLPPLLPRLPSTGLGQAKSKPGGGHDGHLGPALQPPLCRGAR